MNGIRLTLFFCRLWGRKAFGGVVRRFAGNQGAGRAGGADAEQFDFVL